MRHAYFLFRATAWLVLAFVRAAWYFKYRALQTLALPHPESLSSKEKRRLKHYFYGTTYLSIVFCSLRGSTRTKQEKHLFTNLAALAYFFDDLVDSFREQDNSGILWQDNPEKYGRTADERGLALHFLYNIYQELPAADLKEFQAFMHRVFNIETSGRQQKDGSKTLKSEDLKHITAEKGGYSVLLFRRVLQHPLDKAEQNALYQFGCLIQLCDDIFDLWFDKNEGIATLATAAAQHGDLKHLAHLFEQQVLTTRQAFRRTRYPRPNIETSLRVIHFIVSITRVCLKEYADLQKKHGTLPLDQRHLMVIDMERWHNRIQSAVLLWRDE
jgi:hypothetical protein